MLFLVMKSEKHFTSRNYLNIAIQPHWNMPSSRNTKNYVNKPPHLWDVGDRVHLHLSGAYDLWGSGVQDLHSNGEQ